MNAAARKLAFRALAISLALHTLVLLQTTQLTQARISPASPNTTLLAARLRLRPPPAPTANPAQTTHRPPPADKVSDTHTARPTPYQSSEANQPSTASPAPISALTLQPTQASHKSVNDSESEGLRQYRLDLALNARPFRPAAIFPTRIQPSSQATTIASHIRLHLMPASTTPHLTLDSSSGDALADQAALNMLEHAARITPIPTSLRDQAHSVVIQVEFTDAQSNSPKTSQGGGGDNSAR